MHYPNGGGDEETRLGDMPADKLIDREACMGSGNCLYWAPGVFELDDDGVAVVCGDFTDHVEQVRRAAQNCPTGAIRVDGLSSADE
jgi:ferredoxin